LLIYLDANIVIYLIEQPPVWGPRAAAYVAALRGAGDTMAVSDLTRLECRVKPLSVGDAPRVAQFDAFFLSSDVQVLPLSAAVCDRATLIRAVHHFRLADSLHLACAVEGACDRFVTNDVRLNRFPDIPVEVLP
jgi:predicted nucleic acid-binding protein